MDTTPYEVFNEITYIWDSTILKMINFNSVFRLCFPSAGKYLYLLFNGTEFEYKVQELNTAWLFSLEINHSKGQSNL